MSLEKQLFQLVTDGNYKEALEFIKLNPSIDVNALDDKGMNFLMKACIFTSKKPEFYLFLEQLLSNPLFTQAAALHPKSHATIMGTATNSCNTKLISTLLNHHQSKDIDVVRSGGRLLFEKVTLVLKQMNATINSAINPEHTKSIIRECTSILSLLRDVAIRRAALTDDVALLDELAQAGANVRLPLSDGTTLENLVDSMPDSKVHAWLQAHPCSQQSSSSLASMRDSAQLVSEAQLEHHAAKKAVLQSHHDQQSQLIRAFFKLPSDPNVSGHTGSTPTNN